MTYSTRFVVSPERGLGLRPAARFVRVASQFAAEIVVGQAGRGANGKSLLDLALLGPPPGAELDVVARGEDAEVAIRAIEDLFKGAAEDDYVLGSLCDRPADSSQWMGMGA